MNLLIWPSESQVMSTSVASRLGLPQPADRIDRKELAERPSDSSSDWKTEKLQRY